MTEEKYTDSDKYQQEIAAQYKERVAKFSTKEAAEVLDALGFAGIDPDSLQEASAGNVHATYVGQDLVVKLNKDRDEVNYLPDKLASDRLGAEAPVVKVLAYDNFERTDFEALVMERAPGTMLLDDIFEMDSESQKQLFRQVLDVVKKLETIEFNDFGQINQPNENYSTFSEFLSTSFARNIETIRRDKLAIDEDIEQIEQYFMDRVNLFADEKSVFVHTDLHMGNILHDREKLTAVLDFDGALKAPAITALTSLLGFIGNPSQYVEGTKDFPKYKGKNFLNLLPVLRAELPELLKEPNLFQKLNLLYVESAVSWISQNWSSDWNKEMVRDLIKNELSETDLDLDRTFYGRTLGSI